MIIKMNRITNDNNKTVDLDIERLKSDLYAEVIIHQNVGTGEQKPCNRATCHLNVAFDLAARRQLYE